MDDLVGGLLMLTVIGMAIAVAVAIAIAMVLASAAIGSLVVGLAGASAFFASLAGRMRSRGGAERRPLAPEPAFELYVLGQLRRDVGHAGRDAWTAMQRMRGRAEQFAAGLEGWVTPLAVGAVVGAYVGVGIGSIVCALITLPVILAAGIVTAGAWGLIGILRLAESVRRRARRTSYECPVDHERFPLPVYVCPSCSAEHRSLTPGRWGVVKRECRCGDVALPTMVLNGRQRVAQRCPSGHPMAGIIGYTAPLRVALVGGPRAGKSTFLAGALHALDELSGRGQLALGVVEGSRRDFDAALDDLANGRLPKKTAAGQTPALVAEIQGRAGRSRVLSLYDVAGESYAADDAIRDLRFLEVPDGLVLLVDPLALDRFAADHDAEIAAAEDQLRPSRVKAVRVLETTLGALAEAGARTGRLPVAVVVAKSDALGIDRDIAATGAEPGDAVRAWLEHQGGGNFVRAVEAAFGNVGYFAASALGRSPEEGDHRAYVPVGTAEPILWLLRQNGVMPAAGRFVPRRDADRLTGASAADFPPISPWGWAWRAAPAAVVMLAVVAGLVVGTASAVRALTDSGVLSGSEARADRGEEGGDAATSRKRAPRRFDRGEFTLSLPASWRAGARDIDHGSFVESRWYAPTGKETLVKVNHTTGFDQSAASGARSVRNLVRKAASYEELDWRPARIDGRSAWRWEFMLGNRHKVDYFVTDDCGTGFAILGETTPGRWERYGPIIERTVRRLRLAC